MILTSIVKLTGEKVNLIGSGRTDSGVHALGQVANFKILKNLDNNKFLNSLNSILPQSIAIKSINQVSENFHSRFDATERSYLYCISRKKSTFYMRFSYQNRSIDFSQLNRLNVISKVLLGEHDFSSFRALACQAKSPVRTLQRLDVVRSGDLLYLDVQANAFLHHMVRNIAGVLVTVGCGEQPVDWIADVLAHRDRTRGGVTAPASGLYLVGVSYPERFSIALEGVIPGYE